MAFLFCILIVSTNKKIYNLNYNGFLALLTIFVSIIKMNIVLGLTKRFM